MTVLFDFSDCYDVALLATNCDFQVKQWGKLLALPSVVWTTCIHQHSRYISALFRMAYRGIFFFCSVGLVLCKVLEGSALSSLVWFSTNKVHVFGTLFWNIVSSFSIFPLPCCFQWLMPQNFMQKPHSCCCLFCWRLVTGLTEESKKGTWVF